MFCDYVLIHDLLASKFIFSCEYMSSIDLNRAYRIDYLNRHGHPECPRVVLNEHYGNFNWSHIYRKDELKDKFLQTLQDNARVSTDEDRLIVIITGHGAPSGAIAIGEYRLLLRPSNPRLLNPTDVFNILRSENFKGEATVIVNACYSGIWAASAAETGMGRAGSGMTVVVRSSPDEEIHSFPESGSSRYRGGHFF